jgi:hypothetical protein
MFVVAGQFYIGADNGSTDDTYRQSVSSGIFKIESRESGTWTDRFNISSAGAATFSNNLFARRGSFGTASNFSFDLYNNGTSYFNGAVTIDDNATITNSGNIKIGSSTTVTPATQADDIVIDKGASESGITIVSTAAASLRFGDAASASVGYIEYNHSSNAFSFGTNGATRLTISSAGDVKVTSGSFYNSVSGITKIGNAGDYEFIDALGSGTRRFRPATDDAIDIGDASHRFDDIFATNGTINTSDKNQKNTITESDLGLDFVKKLLPKSYKFNNKTRTHYGLISQDVEDLLSDISKDTQDFAGFIKSPKDIDDKNNSEFIYGLRYNEFIAPMIKAIQEQQVIIEDLKSRIEALEG